MENKKENIKQMKLQILEHKRQMLELQKTIINME